MRNLNSASRWQFLKGPVALGLCLCVSISLCGRVYAQSESAGPNPADLEKLEMKMFSRQYPNDPPEKRVERLELLVFGATQPGGMDERWVRISKVMKERQNAEATVAQPSKADTAPASPAATAAPLKGNYPAVDSLEWRVLKKTYRAEPISQRLSRLETKLLGQASPAMALFDRVERLKKIGASVVAGSQSSGSGQANLPPSILGPMPKAYPRGMPFMFGDANNPAMPSPFSIQPFSGNDDSTGMSQINRMMSEMMSQMNRQMRDLKNMPPGVYQYKLDPLDPGSSGLSPFKTMPNNQPNSPFQPLTPKKMPTLKESLPPYADPNSI